MSILQNKRQYLSFILWLSIIGSIIIASCAKVAPLSGGPEDTTPPLVEEYDPTNYATNFNSKKIEIEFNEFIQLDGVNQKLMISPPLEEDPDIDTKGKSLVIEIYDTLKKNTTYTFYFSDAIVDLHESNPIENFQYVFSTGDEVDSMKVSGKVVSAWDKKPAKDIYVMLYADKYDSIPMKERPLYLTKTDEKGVFNLTNLKDTTYKIFALNDVNANYLYDLPNEKIAFTDSIIKPRQVTLMKSYKVVDTTASDSIKTSNNDSIPGKSLAPESSGSADTLTLNLFRDRDTTLQLTSGTMDKNRNIKLGFNKPVDSFAIKALKPQMKEEWYIPEWNDVKDSVILWLTDFKRDSLMMTFQMDSTLKDTLTFTYFEKTNDNEPTRKEPGLGIDPILQNNVQIPVHPMILKLSRPLSEQGLIKDSLFLYSSEDTTRVTLEKTGLREVSIDYDWNDDMSYRLYLPDSTFVDMFGNKNDSTVLKFTTQPKDEYGTLIIKASVLDNEYDYIVHLLSKDEKEIIKKTTVKSDTTLRFKFLEPDKYKLKAIEDKNRNGVWDPGLYIRHEQPEEVIYFETIIEIMANWEVEYNWKIKP